MTAPHDTPGRLPDAVDAEFVSLAGASAPVRPPRLPAVVEASPVPAEGLALFGRPAPMPSRATSPAAFWAGGSIAIAAAFWFSGGYSLVGSQEVATTPVAIARGLEISAIESRVEANNGSPVLYVDATVSNPTASHLQVPDIAVSIASGGRADADRYVMHHKEILAPGARVTFSLRLAAPSGDAKAVDVAFLR